MASDFKILEEVCEFLKHKPIHSMLKWLSREHITGYEKWLQFELAHWFGSQGHGVKIEYELNADQRMTGKEKMRVDLGINLKYQNNDKWHAIELKVKKRSTGALVQSIEDHLRLQTASGVNWPFRSVTTIGFFHSDNLSKYREFFQKLRESKSLEIETKEIEHPNVGIYILGWRVPPRKAIKDEYIEFTKHFLDIAKECGLDRFEKIRSNRTPKASKKRKITKAKNTIKK